jgi:hypothetical protein
LQVWVLVVEINLVLSVLLVLTGLFKFQQADLLVVEGLWDRQWIWEVGVLVVLVIALEFMMRFISSSCKVIQFITVVQRVALVALLISLVKVAERTANL